MLNGIHFLLTYKCNYECDHCFLYCGPHSEGTFTLEQIRTVLDEAVKIGTVEWIYFEGGEPFLFYPLMLEGLKIAYVGFETGYNELLQEISKNATKEDFIEASKKLMRADITLSATFINGLGGANRPDISIRHAEESADLVNKI